MVPRMPALKRFSVPLATVATLAVLVATMGYATAPRGSANIGPAHFLTADRCVPCHNSLTTRSGRDASIGIDWRASMMANSSRDPYWQASVRREMLDHPTASAEIEDECSICHMPMQRFAARAAGGQGVVFAHSPTRRGTDPLDSLSADGVSCTVCHQIQKTRLGDSSSFNGGFVIDITTPVGRRPVFGPYEVNRGHTTVMHSSSGFVPTQSDHIRQSELCATCHTLYTPALDPAGRRIGTPARAGAISRMAAQRVSRQGELPVLSHAPRRRERGQRSDHIGAGPAASGCAAALVPRRKLLRARHAEPVPRGAGCRGVSTGVGCRRGADPRSAGAIGDADGRGPSPRGRDGSWRRSR